MIRNYPMIPGIDVSGTVVTSEDPRFKEGDKVIVTGYQLGLVILVVILNMCVFLAIG